MSASGRRDTQEYGGKNADAPEEPNVRVVTNDKCHLTNYVSGAPVAYNEVEKKLVQDVGYTLRFAWRGTK